MCKTLDFVKTLDFPNIFNLMEYMLSSWRKMLQSAHHVPVTWYIYICSLDARAFPFGVNVICWSHRALEIIRIVIMRIRNYWTALPGCHKSGLMLSWSFGVKPLPPGNTLVMPTALHICLQGNYKLMMRIPGCSCACVPWELWIPCS